MTSTALLKSIAATLCAALAGAAHAEGRQYAINDALYRNECGSCHVAYPPQLLGAETWHRLFRQLDRHFGVDASLDAPTTDKLSRYVDSLARRRHSNAEDSLRITRTTWFQREHLEVPRVIWSDKRVGSASNCSACHKRADQGDYSEATLRMPMRTWDTAN
jgi:cytochrome c553